MEWGELNVEKRRFMIPKTVTLKDVKKIYLKDIGADSIDHVIGDENHYIFAEAELEKPLYNYSNGCRLNVSLFYKNHWSQISNEIMKPIKAYTGIQNKKTNNP